MNQLVSSEDRNAMLDLIDGLEINTYAPDAEDIMNAFDLLDNNINNVRCVIIGQDPYPQISGAKEHTVKYADGLAFSAGNANKCPDSLFNLLSILVNDYYACPDLGVASRFVASRSYNLSSWASQGVLLLNARMIHFKDCDKSTYESMCSTSKNILTKVIEKFAGRRLPYIAFGAEAREYTKLMDKTRNLVMEFKHPSNFAQLKTFGESGQNMFESRAFSKANSFIVENGGEPINWMSVF